MSEWLIDLEAFELVLLRRPPDAPSYDEATLAQIQSEHLAYHASLSEGGTMIHPGMPVGEPA